MRMTFLLAASAVALAACGSTTETEEATGDGEATEASWSYEGETGPDNWGALNADYALCADGTVQSPIDLTREGATDGAVNLQINWASGSLTVEGHGYNANIVAPEGGSITLDGETFNFVQAHMHTPSEYTLDGQTMAADIHFVHANEAGELAVIGVFIAEGEANAALGSALDAMTTGDESTTVEGATLDPTSMLPENRSFFRFVGSLTTPPCSEGVNWVFMSEPITASAEQINRHMELFGATARPVQPTGDREMLFVGG